MERMISVRVRCSHFTKLGLQGDMQLGDNEIECLSNAVSTELQSMMLSNEGSTPCLDRDTYDTHGAKQKGS